MAGAPSVQGGIGQVRGLAGFEFVDESLVVAAAIVQAAGSGAGEPELAVDVSLDCPALTVFGHFAMAQGNS